MSLQRTVLIRELRQAAEKVADIIRTADTTIKIPNSEWTAGDEIAHVVVSQHHYISFMTGKNSYIADPESMIEGLKNNLSRDYLAKLNKKFLDKFSQREGPALAELLIKEVNHFITVGKKFPDTQTFNTHFGKITLLNLFSYCLLHLISHGSSTAKTLNKPLPATMINTGLTIPFIKVAMVKLFDKKIAGDLTANFVFAIKNVETFVIHIHKGEIKIDNHISSAIDARVSLDSLTFFLGTNGYMPIWKALFTGKMSLSGKRPWLILKLQSLFKGL